MSRSVRVVVAHSMLWLEASILLALAVALVAVFTIGESANAVGAEDRSSAGPVQPAEAAGDELYGRCLACHAIEFDRVGPRHCGLFGRLAGSVSGFAYSDAMKNSGIVWGRDTLDQFLRDPMGVVPGTLMTYAGVSDSRERATLIAWLRVSTSPERCRPAGSGPVE